jgi:hypothetical protein
MFDAPPESALVCDINGMWMRGGSVQWQTLSDACIQAAPFTMRQRRRHGAVKAHDQWASGCKDSPPDALTVC